MQLRTVLVAETALAAGAIAPLQPDVFSGNVSKFVDPVAANLFDDTSSFSAYVYNDLHRLEKRLLQGSAVGRQSGQRGFAITNTITVNRKRISYRAGMPEVVSEYQKTTVLEANGYVCAMGGEDATGGWITRGLKH